MDEKTSASHQYEKTQANDTKKSFLFGRRRKCILPWFWHLFFKAILKLKPNNLNLGFHFGFHFRNHFSIIFGSQNGAQNGTPNSDYLVLISNGYPLEGSICGSIWGSVRGVFLSQNPNFYCKKMRSSSLAGSHLGVLFWVPILTAFWIKIETWANLGSHFEVPLGMHFEIILGCHFGIHFGAL